MTIIELNFEHILPLWKDESMFGDTIIKAVSSMKYWNGLDHHGGNEMSVYDLDKSNPVYLGYIVGLELAGGVSFFSMENNIYRTRGLFVYPKHRNKGIATKLLNRVISRVHERHDIFEEGILWAMAGPNSIAAHRRVGFDQISEQFSHDLPDGNITNHYNCYMRYRL